MKLPSVANLRENWRVKAARAKAQRFETWVSMAQSRRPQLVLPAVITITRIAPRQLDGDNLQSACKAVRDGVADWLHIDDGSKDLEWKYMQRKGLPKEHAVQIDVEDAR